MSKSYKPNLLEATDRVNHPIGGIDNALQAAVTILEHHPEATPNDPPDDIHWVLTQAGPGLASGCYLTATEIQSGRRYRHPERHRQWMLGRATAKYLLMQRATPLDLSIQASNDFEILRNPNGWPQLQDRHGRNLPVSLTISHRDELAFSAVCRDNLGNLGADIEIIAPKNASMLEDFYTPEERNWIQSQASPHQALTATLIWSAKESILKAIKTGLMENTKIIRLIPNEDVSQPGNRWNQIQAVIRQQTIPVWWTILNKHNLCITLVRI